MDVLSSCYRRTVRLFRDIDTLHTVRWYFVKDTAKDFPIRHAFGSGVWDDHNCPGEPGLGVESGPRVWDKGLNVNNYDGTCHTGTADQWAHGLRLSDPPLVGRPACCGPTPPHKVPVRITPKSVWEVPYVYTCSACPGGASRKWEVTVAGGTGDFAVFNGTWIMLYDGSCTWSTAADPGITLQVGGISLLHLTHGAISPVAATYLRVAPAVCAACFTLHLSSQAGGAGAMPATLEVCPSPHPIVFTFAGRAALAIAARDTLRQGYKFRGRAGLSIAPRSTWVAPPSFAGGAGLTIAPASSWSTPFAYDCSACPAGIQRHSLFDGSGFAGVFADCAPSFQADYVGSCNFVGNTGSCAWNVSVVDVGTGPQATLSVSNSATGDLAQYFCAAYDGLGGNAWNLSTTTSPGDSPASTTSAPV